MCSRVRFASNFPNNVVPRLPVIRDDDPHSDWHAYLDKVYTPLWRGRPLDLNLFTWFYWGSPLDRIVVPRCSWIFDSNNVSVNEAWISPYVIPGQTFMGCKNTPEGLLNQWGFFVYREKSRMADQVEIIHVRYPEVHYWFYHCVGSGIFIHNLSLPLHWPLQQFSATHPNIQFRKFDKLRHEMIVYDKGRKQNKLSCPPVNLMRLDGSLCTCNESFALLNCDLREARFRSAIFVCSPRLSASASGIATTFLGGIFLSFITLLAYLRVVEHRMTLV